MNVNTAIKIGLTALAVGIIGGLVYRKMSLSHKAVNKATYRRLNTAKAKEELLKKRQAESEQNSDEARIAETAKKLHMFKDIIGYRDVVEIQAQVDEITQDPEKLEAYADMLSSINGIWPDTKVSKDDVEEQSTSVDVVDREMVFVTDDADVTEPEEPITTSFKGPNGFSDIPGLIIRDPDEVEEMVDLESRPKKKILGPIPTGRPTIPTASEKTIKESLVVKNPPTEIPVIVPGQNVLAESPVRTEQDDFEHLVAQCNFNHEKRKEEFNLACEHAKENPFIAFADGEVTNVAIQENGVYVDVRYKSKYTTEMKVAITHKLPIYSHAVFKPGDLFKAGDVLAKEPYTGVEHDVLKMQNRVKKSPSHTIKVGTVIKVKNDAHRNPLYIAVRYSLPRYGHVILRHPVVSNDIETVEIMSHAGQIVNINQCLYR